MIRTPINKDIGKIRNKDVWLLTWREVIYGGIAAAIGGPACFMMYRYIGISAAVWLTMIIVLPIGAIGFFSLNGLTLLDILKSIIVNRKPLVFGDDFEAGKKRMEREIAKEQKKQKKETNKNNKKKNRRVK